MNGGWRTFLAGVLCGTIVMGGLGAAWVWWKPVHLPDDWIPVRSAEDHAIHDACLATGKTVVACDALLRVLYRARETEQIEQMKTQAAALLAAGFSKREVVQWGLKKGFAASQMIDAVGISMKDYRDDKY